MFFFSVMFCRSSHSQMFLKIDFLRNFASFTRKHLCWSLFFDKVAGKVFKNTFFYRTPPVAVFVVFEQNNLIFSVISITIFGINYNQKLSWKYCNYYHPPYIKISISYQKYAHLVQEFCSLLSPILTFLNLSNIYFCIISVFLRLGGDGGGGVSHSYTVSLIEGLSKIECKRRTHRCPRDVPETIPWLSKFI